MLSAEIEIVLLIVALYASTCVVFVYANEGVLARAWSGLDLRISEGRLRVFGRSPLLLNPLAPMWPAFRGTWGDAGALADDPRLPPRVADAITASRTLAPYVAVVALCVVVGIPAALLFAGAARAIPLALLAYVAVAVMLVRLWFLRRRFALDGLKFALVAFESIACPPFAAGVVRRLSLAMPLADDLATYLAQTPVERRTRFIAQLDARCEELASFHADDSPRRNRIDAYRARIATLAVSPQSASADVAAASAAKEPQ